MAKTAVLQLLDFLKLISRKIGVTERSQNFHTVHNLYRLTGFITIIGSAASLLADVDAGEQLLLDGEAVTLRDAPPLLAFFDYFWRQLIKKVFKLNNKNGLGEKLGNSVMQLL